MRSYILPLLLLLSLFSIFLSSYVRAQDQGSLEKQLWAMAFFNIRLDHKWTLNEDVGYRYSHDAPSFSQLFLRTQINHQLTGALSFHGGLNFLYKFNDKAYNSMEIRPWLGTKIRWPHIWRFNVVHYLRFEQRFEHTNYIHDWENNFRFRYKLGTSIPINHASIQDNTLYGILSYEFFSVSFEDDFRLATAATHRYDIGLGYRQNAKNIYEVLAITLRSRNEDQGNYSLSGMVLFLRYRRFINWN